MGFTYCIVFQKCFFLAHFWRSVVWRIFLIFVGPDSLDLKSRGLKSSGFAGSEISQPLLEEVPKRSVCLATCIDGRGGKKLEVMEDMKVDF